MDELEMTRDDIIKMAREADLVSWLPNSTYSDGVWWIDAHEPGSELERFAALVAASEREACAKACDELHVFGSYRELQIATLQDAAAAIRHRSEIDSIVQNERSARGQE